MPVEIRELVIRATVEEDPESAARARGQPATAGGPAPGVGAQQRSRLIRECVDQVMEVLREQKER